MVEVLIFVGDGVQINVLCAEMEYWCTCVLHKDADGRMVRSSQNMAGRFQRASTRVTNVTDFVGRCVMSIATGLASTPSNLHSKNNAN
jgi:hypothetical protein